MIVVGFIAIALWLIGSRQGWPVIARLLMIGVLVCLVIAVHLLLPDDHPVREALGGGPRDWVFLLFLTGAVWAYRYGFGYLRAHVRPENQVPDHVDPERKGFSAAELDRYARHIVLREIGGPGQTALSTARVLVVGAGGLGSPVLQYLGGAGVGTIGIIDPDTVSLSNLQRQVIYRQSQDGEPKVFAAAAILKALNPHVTVRPYHRALTAEIAEDLLADYDLVLDGCDSFDTRVIVNKAAVTQGIPLISGALTQWEGQVSVFDPAKGGPCYTCAFPNKPDPALLPTCAEAGVAGPLPGIIGSMMALEAVKVITGAGSPLTGRLHIYDGLYGDTRTINLARDPNCPICHG